MDSLTELAQEIRGYVKWQKRQMRLVTLLVGPFLLVVIAMAILDAYDLGPFRHAPTPVSWDSVTTAMSQADPDKALQIAATLAEKAPNDPAAYRWLGYIYVAKGDLREAERHYSRAYDLLPTKTCEERLEEIRKALARKAATSADSEKTR